MSYNVTNAFFRVTSYMVNIVSYNVKLCHIWLTLCRIWLIVSYMVDCVIYGRNTSSKIQRTRIEIDEKIDNKTSCMFYT